MRLLDETLNTFASELQALRSPAQVGEKRRELQAWVRQQFQGLSSLQPDNYGALNIPADHPARNLKMTES